MPLQLVIIADDLTGALDAAAPFATMPGGVKVATRPSALDLSDADVVAVSTRSRDCPADEARKRVAAVFAELPPGVRVMKKVDSRLKGNIAAELEPLKGQLFVAPAIPEFGRVVQGEAVFGFGVDKPIPVALALGAQKERAFIPDTRTPEEMLKALKKATEDAVFVGARGLSVALAADMNVLPAVPPQLIRPVCFAVGSTDPITLAQVAALRAAYPQLHYVSAPSGQAPASSALSESVTLVQATQGESAVLAQVAQSFAVSVAPYLQEAQSILLTGGATAEAMLDEMGIDQLHLVAEALPGLPICIANEQMIVTKSGGFGDADTFVRLLAGGTEQERDAM